MSAAEESCCLPGDITLAQVHTGWMVGKALGQAGPGPWWTFIAVFADFDSALREARTLAQALGVRLWFHAGGTKYHAIPLDDSPYAPPV
jgi:hypothetical protein